MYRKVMEMLEMQDGMNRKVHPQWKSQQFEWYRAIWIESAELMEHHGWKWWKKQDPDMAQVRLEIIDIWHFGLSILLQKGDALENIAHHIIRIFSTVKEEREMNLLQCTEIFVHNTLACQDDFDIEGFYRILRAASMSFDNLYCGYIGKNVLNFFRQDHGYKKGIYKKVWNGKEDNEHLAELAESLDHESVSFRDDLYNALSTRYRNCT